MNFIRHYKGWLQKVVDDQRLTPHHVCLYIALFETWNHSFFRNPITIYRDEVMRISKIGSKTTYVKCLRELTEWGYISYVPSFNPQQGSQVHLYRFDTGTGTDRGPGTGPAIDSAGGPAPGPMYKTIPNKKNTLNLETADDTSPDRSDFFSSGDTHKKRKGRGRAGRADLPGSVEEVRSYFVEIRSTAAEADKFCNYFQSNGWKIGGRAPMQDWRAAARHWITNIKTFTHEHTPQPKPGKLNTGPKNYSEPL